MDGAVGAQKSSLPEEKKAEPVVGHLHEGKREAPDWGLPVVDGQPRAQRGPRLDGMRRTAPVRSHPPVRRRVWGTRYFCLPQGQIFYEPYRIPTSRHQLLCRPPGEGLFSGGKATFSTTGSPGTVAYVVTSPLRGPTSLAQ